MKGSEVPKKVLTFYYGWYGRPELSGKWVHWKEVDEANKTIGSSTNFPRLGAYDSHDSELVKQHCKWAKEAGGDVFIATWWRQSDFHDEGMKLLLDTANRHGLEVTVYFEIVREDEPKNAVEDVLYLLNQYSEHPAWLKLDGKPVLFVYGRAVNQIDLTGWQQVIQSTNESCPAIFIGDRISGEAASIFDGIHKYNITGIIAGKSAEEIRTWANEVFPEWVETAGADCISCITIIPGYDDSKIGRDDPRPITDRHEGETFRILWEAAIEANPDWVLITSWNEWHEGSEIEPSLAHGDRELKITGEFAPRFKLLDDAGQK